ncbi:hypothetical protein GCM10010918_12240 [Paenibacillus radicis (ex Gao et al. 2016)]|uniref:DUF559 domain-containing protein n=1 Tax=Paenibacillus radicis (ex Gao et al. 2016) TaxID=1737354 RepID=A0A917GXW4_9BACL|nr:hypothetical protein GCM10010918_12240 [Paenibacillus radicis (ex Gao et al. 2016)]
MDSCFWHGCPIHYRLPSTNVDYWSNKINRNKVRDVKVTNYYKDRGWSILRFWEHEIKQDITLVIDTIIKLIDNEKQVKGGFNGKA